MKSTLIFNDISSADLGLVIQAPPTYEFPERDMASTHIVGRNGDLVVDNKCYKNVSRSYSLAMGYTAVKHHMPNATAILEWLTSANGQYVRLEDSYDSDVYRLARFYSSGSFTDYYDEALAISVSFECKPQRFLKTGDIPYSTKGPVAYADNPSHYDALPLIRIDNIPDSTNRVLMLSILDSNNEVTSNITMSNITGGTVCINSDTQNCYDDDGDINESVFLNGKDFPVFGKEKTTLKVEKFISDYKRIDPFNTIINNYITDTDGLVVSKFRSKTNLVELNQNKVSLKSYSSLIDSNKKTYSASSYQAYISSVCSAGNVSPYAESFTFTSFNTILSNYGQQYAISGDIAGLTFPEWLTAIKSNDKIILKAGVAGFFMTSNDKVITYFAKGDVITSTTTSKTTTIYYYEAVNGKKELYINYPEIPDWINVIIGYEQKGNTVTLASVTYKTAKSGYYWTDKTWTFGKAQWAKYETPTVLNTLTWNTSKKAFMSTKGISTSTTTSYTYKFFESVVQYEDTDKTPLTFRTEIGANDLSSIKIYTKDAGWYCVSVGGKDPTQWVKRGANEHISNIQLSGTTAFTVYYIDKVPDYSTNDDYEKWKDWLNPVPIGNKTGSDGSNDLLNSSTITFTILQNSKYRWTTGKDDDGNDTYSDWKEYDANASLNFNKSVDDNISVCKLDEMPTEYEFDRCYNEAASIPSFLTAKYFSDKVMTKPIDASTYRELEDKTNCMVEFSTNKDGYYKWGTNSAWIYKKSGEVLFSTGYKDDATFYYMDKIPSYETYDLYSITPHVDSTGNPDEVYFTVKEAGYYRVNSNSDWTWFDISDSLTTSVVGKETIIYHLRKLDEDLSNLNITITPHWWKL